MILIVIVDYGFLGFFSDMVVVAAVNEWVEMT